MPRPLLLVPGFMGTRLRDEAVGKPVWGTLGAVYSRRTFERLVLPLHPTDDARPLTVDGPVIRLVFPIYRGLLRRFRDRRIEVLEYDWRLSNNVAAEGLVHRVREIGEPVDIVAHCSAGLLVELALATGGADHVHHVVFVGYPREGAACGFQFIVEGIRLAPAGARFTPPFLFSLPSIFELFPTDGRLFGPEGPDIWEAEAWRDRSWSAFDARHRRRAELLFGPEDLDRRMMDHLRLMLTGARTARERVAESRRRIDLPIRIYASSGRKTVAGARETPKGPRFDVMEPGDGTATVRSCSNGGGDSVVVRPTSRAHRYLLEDPEILEDIAKFLG